MPKKKHGGTETKATKIFRDMHGVAPGGKKKTTKKSKKY